MPNQLLGVLLHTMGISGLPRVRTELARRLVVVSLTKHPLQTNRQAARHSDLGDLSPPPQHQVKILSAPFRNTAHRDLCRFHQQKAQHRISLLGDVS